MRVRSSAMPFCFTSLLNFASSRLCVNVSRSSSSRFADSNDSWLERQLSSSPSSSVSDMKSSAKSFFDHSYLSFACFTCCSLMASCPFWAMSFVG